jgi:hypothetical protein
MAEIHIDVWLYGNLAEFGGEASEGSFANLQACLQEGSTIADLLDFLRMPTEQRGITFINGDLSAMPGLQPDLRHLLQDGDRVAFFHPLSMWPFQYRHGVAMVNEMASAMKSNPDQSVHHSYDDEDRE